MSLYCIMVLIITEKSGSQDARSPGRLSFEAASEQEKKKRHQVFHYIKDEDKKYDKDSKLSANNVLGQMISFEFVLAMLLMKNLMIKTQIAVELFQQEELGILQAGDEVHQTAEVLQHM
ncbi:hypothetical protein NDU88_008546 [Pleurodeles waltl]|uniref:Uncharacterized protein n=1 Tax=Pleurodeles waltl TaxID=8319 RepID=A0AAV7NWV4_PLEWA|nr:hypothetical protein NDU88_008546 [Pleurodeles waltl]